MAKVTLPQTPTALTPRVIGVFYVRADPYRGYVAESWPHKYDRTVGQAYQNYKQLEWKTAGQWSASPSALDHTNGVALSAGSNMVWRDIIMKAIYGRLYTLTSSTGLAFYMSRDVDPNPQLVLDLVTDEVGDLLIRTVNGWMGLSPGNPGQVIAMEAGLPAWSTLEADIQAILDTITSTTGSILVRTAAGWSGLAPGTGGYVLTVDAITNLPTWEAVPGVGPTGQTAVGMTAINFSAGNLFNNSFYGAAKILVPKGFVANYVCTYVTAFTAGAVVEPGIYQVTGAHAGTLLKTGADFTITATGVIRVPLASTLNFAADTACLIGLWSKTNSYTGASCPGAQQAAFANSAPLPNTITTWTDLVGTWGSFWLET